MSAIRKSRHAEIPHGGQLRNPKWEMFSQELARGKPTHHAYDAAGFSTRTYAGGGNANNLKHKPAIVARVAELLAEHAERHRKASEKAVEALAIDRGWVLAKMIEEQSAASAAGQHSSAIRALELLGREFGLFIERKDFMHRHEMMTDDELDAAISRFARLEDAEGKTGLPGTAH